MARKERTITIETDNRDKGKQFLITEKSARAAHDWATRMLFAMGNAGAEFPSHLLAAGVAGMARIGLEGIARVPPAVGKPLLEELLDCVQIKMPAGVRKWVDEDFEDFSTIFRLQEEVFNLHVEGFTLGGKSTLELSPQTPEPID